MLQQKGGEGRRWGGRLKRRLQEALDRVSVLRGRVLIGIYTSPQWSA